MGGTFSVDLSRLVRKAEVDMNQVVRKVILDLSRAVVLRTPVDTGRARASWVAGIHSVPADSPEDKDPTGGRAIARMASLVQGLEAGTVVYIVSNLSYMPILEYGREDGRPGSAQAPQGMVRVTLQEFQDHVDRAAREVRGGRR
ncbi:hypothetical protein GGQ74_001139 [Desulfobaculum xiamenense]|uniref:HK97 gp10 family phage protein n=1 Tax=Desulfobaculum xiamenense TaxID=995050 RepID=A0A846QS61_9BACT|nr:HK97 gp10 family phage protein [Desulfobaculum xiamenense]NJB67499.1 hypothetical protein [Desulfobaculum xiamenense]